MVDARHAQRCTACKLCWINAAWMPVGHVRAGELYQALLVGAVLRCIGRELVATGGRESRKQSAVYTCTACLLHAVDCDLHGWPHQVPIYWNGTLPSPYFPLLLQSPEVHPRRPITTPGSPPACGSSQQHSRDQGPCSPIRKTAKINVSPTHDTRLCSSTVDSLCMLPAV